jgi:hypothetical protein
MRASQTGRTIADTPVAKRGGACRDFDDIEDAHYG